MQNQISYQNQRHLSPVSPRSGKDLIKLLLQRACLGHGPGGFVLVTEDDVGKNRLGDAKKGLHLTVKLRAMVAEILARAVRIGNDQTAAQLPHFCLVCLLGGLEIARGHHRFAVHGLEHELDAGIDNLLAVALMKRRWS